MPAAPHKMPETLPGYEVKLAYWAARRAERRALAGHQIKTPIKFPVQPKGLLLHSGAGGIGTAEWAWQEPDLDGDDDDLGALYWAHAAFSRKLKRYFLTDYLWAWCPHGGGLNRFAYGVETPHYPGCDPRLYKDQTIAIVAAFVSVGVEWITCHKYIEPKKRDPGPCVTADWFVHLPVRLYFGDITIQHILECEGLD